MAQSRVLVEVDTKRLRQVAEAFQWFAGRLSAAADELFEALNDIAPLEPQGPPDPRYPEDNHL